MPIPFLPNVDFLHTPTGYNFLLDRSPVQMIRGAYGSGKTVVCCTKIMMLALEQEPGPDNIRRTRAAIVRNTAPMLLQTTMETWLGLFPEIECGSVRRTAPMRQVIEVPPGRNGEPGLRLEIDFLALDRPKDVRKLLSYEGTIIYFNEVREIPKAIIDAADARVGRFKRMVAGVRPTWYGILADTNPPDTHHWYYSAEAGLDPVSREHVGVPEGWSFHVQPPAVLEVKDDGGGAWRSIDKDPRFADIVEYDESLILRAGGRTWVVNPRAENLPNLPVHPHVDPTLNVRGRGSYYGRMLQNKSLDWITVYTQGRFGYVREGKPVIPEFMVDVHVTDALDFNPDLALGGGIDMGGNTLQPAAVLFQRTFRGQLFVGAEAIGDDMGIDRFAQVIHRVKAEFAPDIPFGHLYADPAGRVRDGIYETVAFDAMISRGIPVLPVTSNSIGLRIDAIKAPFNRMIDGKPGILIHRRCANLIAALNGKWHYRTLQRVSQGEIIHSETPEKNHPYSDVGDALGYGCMGSGEVAALIVPPPTIQSTADNPFAVSDHQRAKQGGPGTDWNVFDA